MKIVFWNIYNKNNANLIKNLLFEYDIDIAVFAEHSNLDLSDFEGKCPKYNIASNMEICERLLFFYKKEIEYKIRQEQFYYAIHTFNLKGQNYIIAGLHLPSNSHSASEERSEEIKYLVADLAQIEKEEKTERTIVIGDFNANPFDKELVQKNTFNAVLFKELIRQQNIVSHNHRKYKRFYNPMLNYISELNQHYGTYYYSRSGMYDLRWNCFDQVLVRKDLIDNIIDVRFCKNIGDINLLNKSGIPNKKISDHLPLIVEVSN